MFAVSYSRKQRGWRTRLSLNPRKMKNYTQKQFSVICIGHNPNRTASYIVRRTENINTRIAQPVFQADTYEEAKKRCDEYNKAK